MRSSPHRQRRAIASARLAVFLLAILAPFAALFALAVPAAALTPIVVQADQDRVDVTPLGEAYEGRGDALTVETAPSADGVRGRMSVKAATAGTNPRWLVFALTNPTDKPIERWLTADRYTASGSGIVWPDLDSRRLEAVTPSMGFVPSRVRSDRADIFALTLEPGQTITYVLELATDRFPRVSLWKPLEYEIKARDRQLFNGVMLGLTALAAVFLTSIFAANHKIIFPAAALFSWCVLAYLCVEFGFFHKLFNMKPEDNAVYRAAAEASMAASLVVFLHAFLRLRLSHGLVRLLSLIWIAGQLSLVAVAAIDPRLAATFARISFVGIGGIGAVVTLYLAIRGQDRALHLVPTWILFLIWIFLASVTLSGRLPGDMFTSALTAGLVMVVLLIAFTVTQFAFRSIEPLAGLATGDSQLRAVAVDGARSAVWEWSSRRDEIKTGEIVEEALGLNPGELNVKVEEFLQHVHAADRERFRLILWSVQERAGGKIRADFRMRHADNTYRWFELEAASVPTNDRRSVRCIGLMRDVTDVRIAHERLLHDAVRCSLTGIPNRSLLIDRLGILMARSKAGEGVHPALFFIDIDKFKNVNKSLGLNVGDSVLITVARRLQRHLGPLDTLARVGGDQFAVLFVEDQERREVAALADRVRRSLRSPIHIASQEIVLSASLGIAIYDGSQGTAEDFLREAEIAMFRAKRGGTDRIEVFKAEMREDPIDDAGVEAAMRSAIEKGQLKMLYQPIVYLPTEELAGFEAMIRFEHPKLGLLNPVGVLNSSEDAEYIRKSAAMALTKSLEAATLWQKELPRPEDHLFINLDIASASLLRAELAQEVRHLLSVALVAKGTLRLEIPESVVMLNPELALSVLELLRGAGAEVVLDDFGSGFSSLSYLQRLPFDTFKIDRSMMRLGTLSEEGGNSIVRAMVAMTHELGKKAIAEGIEAPEDVGALRSIGCEYGQGFYYGDPMTERDVLQLLRIIRKSERKVQTHGLFKTKLRSSKKKKREAEAQAQQSAAGVNGIGETTAPLPAAAPPLPASVNGRGDPGIAAQPPAMPSGMMRTRPRPVQRPADPVAATAPPMGAAAAAGMAPPVHNRGPASESPGTQPTRTQPPTIPPASQGLPYQTNQPFPSMSAANGIDGANPPGAGAARNGAAPGSAPRAPSAVTPPINQAPIGSAPSNPASSKPPSGHPASVQLPPIAANGPPRLPDFDAATTMQPMPANGASRHEHPANGAHPARGAENGPVTGPSAPPPIPPSGNGTSPPRPPPRIVRAPRPQPDFSTLPPGIAASLAKLAGVPPPPAAAKAEETRQKEPTES